MPGRCFGAFFLFLAGWISWAWPARRCRIFREEWVAKGQSPGRAGLLQVAYKGGAGGGRVPAARSGGGMVGGMRPWLCGNGGAGHVGSPPSGRKKVGLSRLWLFALEGGGGQSICSWATFSWLGPRRGGERMIARRAGLLREHAGRRSGAGHAHAGGWERSPIPLRNPRPRGELAPPGGRFGAWRGFGKKNSAFGAEPGGGVRNREQGASCLSAASSCPAGSAARRPGSSQRQAGLS